MSSNEILFDVIKDTSVSESEAQRMSQEEFKLLLAKCDELAKNIVSNPQVFSFIIQHSIFGLGRLHREIIESWLNKGADVNSGELVFEDPNDSSVKGSQIKYDRLFKFRMYFPELFQTASDQSVVDQPAVVINKTVDDVQKRSIVDAAIASTDVKVNDVAAVKKTAISAIDRANAAADAVEEACKKLFAVAGIARERAIATNNPADAEAATVVEAGLRKLFSIANVASAARAKAINANNTADVKAAVAEAEAAAADAATIVAEADAATSKSAVSAVNRAITAASFVNKALKKLATIAIAVDAAHKRVLAIAEKASYADYVKDTAAVERSNVAVFNLEMVRKKLATVAAVVTAARERAMVADSTAEVDAAATDAEVAATEATTILAEAEAIVEEAEAAADDARWGSIITIDLEIQNKFYPDYWLPNRFLYYISRLMARQGGMEFSKDHYDDIKRVYSIWICLEPPVALYNRAKWYPMDERDFDQLPGYYLKELRALNLVVLGIHGPDAGNYQGVFKMLYVLLLSRYSLEEKLRILKEELGLDLPESCLMELEEMNSLSEKIRIESEAIGEARGEVRGEARGEAKAFSVFEFAQNLFLAGLPKDEVVAEVKAKFNLSEQSLLLLKKLMCRWSFA